MTTPISVVAKPSPETVRKQRRARLYVLRQKGATRTPAENAELLNILADMVFALTR